MADRNTVKTVNTLEEVMARRLKEGVDAQELINRFLEGKCSATELVDLIIEHAEIEDFDELGEKVSHAYDQRNAQNRPTGVVGVDPDGRYSVKSAYNRATSG